MVVVAAGVVAAGIAGTYGYQRWVELARQGEGLESRVGLFWDAKVAGDLTRAYSLEAASQTGEVDLGSYLGKRSPAIKYLSYEVKSIKEDGDRASVEVEFAYSLRYPQMGDITSATRSREGWVRLGGTWYRETKAGPSMLTPTQ